MTYYAVWIVGAFLGALIVPVLRGGWLIVAGALLGLLIADWLYERVRARDRRRYPT